MIFVYTSKEEEFLIKDYLLSLIKQDEDNKYETIVDKVLKNWYQIYIHEELQIYMKNLLIHYIYN